MSAKFLSIFRNVKNSCLVSLWSSTCHFVCYVCVRERGGQRERLCMCASWLCECVRERERDCMWAVCVCVCVCERESVCNMKVCLWQDCMCACIHASMIGVGFEMIVLVAGCRYTEAVNYSVKWNAQSDSTCWTDTWQWMTVGIVTGGTLHSGNSGKSTKCKNENHCQAPVAWLLSI